ncbi:MAG: hypothetical protein RQ839_11415 [Thermoproteus sp.]|jgi:hypothetical protein|nr:hypothetical protein [Thermoproteus sp.]MDT7883161.1 hypothetical protein [Thermoproteus sp.]
MVLLFRNLYELRAEEAARGGVPVVVVGPPGAGKTTFIKQFLEPKLRERFGDLSRVRVEEVTAGLTPRREEAQGDRREVIRRIISRRYVGGYEAAEELKDVGGADHLKTFGKLPRDFVEYLKGRYGGWSLYLFYIPPDAEEDKDVVERLRKIAEGVGVGFRWLGLGYVPPGVVAMLREGGEGYVEEQLRLYRRILEEFGAAGGRLAKLWELGRSVAEKTGEYIGEYILERFAEAAGKLAEALLLHIPGGAAAGAVLGVASYFLSGQRGWGDWVRLLADWSRLDGRLRDLAAAHIALELGVGKEEVRSVLDSLSNKELEKLEGIVEELRDEVEELWDEVIAQRLAKYGDVYTRRRAEELRVTYHKVVDAGVEYRLVTAGGFAEAAEEVRGRLAERGFVVVAGSRGIGKSTLAAYVAYDMLKRGDVDYVVRVKSPVDVSEVDVFKALGRRALLLFDIYPREVYLEKFDPRRPLEKLYGSVEVLLSLAALAERGREVGAGLYALAAVHDEALAEARGGKAVREWLGGASFYVPRLNTPEFLAGVLKSYACPDENDCCLSQIDAERLVSLISSHDAYTLVVKYTGLWLKERRCDAEKLEEALKSSLRPSKAEPKLYLAHYIWRVLLRGSGNLAMQAAVPLLLHAYFGPVPVGVTYITQAKDGVVFYQPEEIEKFTKPQWDLLRAGLQPIAHWLAQRHEDLVEEVLRDLAGLNGEEARELYKEALGDLIEALDWARGEVLKEGAETFARLSVPEWGRGSAMALLAFVARRLAAVFKSGESRRCWHRAALVIGRALAGHIWSLRELLPKDVAKALGDVLERCAVDDYLTIGDEIPPLSIHVVRFPYYVEAHYARDLPQIRRIRERLGPLSPLADAEAVNAARKTAEELLARWRNEMVTPPETFYALGLAALAAGGEADEETADLLLDAASSAVQQVVHPAAALPVLAALRPLGEKAPHRYVVALAAASELEPLDPVTAQYIYDALQQLKDSLLKTGRRWSLVEAVDAYSNLLRKHLVHIKDRWEEAVADMCSLYSEVRKLGAAAPDRGLSAQRLLDTAARTSVLAVALNSEVLAPLVRRHCGLGDLVKEAEAVRKTLEEAAARPEELRKFVESDEDFAEWVTARSTRGDAWRAFGDLRSWFTAELARYKLVHALDERGELDAGKLKEVAGEFEKAAEMDRNLERWDNYLAARGLALRARVLAAKGWGELLERAEGFRELCGEAEERLQLAADYLAKAAVILGECLVYLAAAGNKEKKEEIVKLLKEWRWLLDYDPRVSVATRLMLRLFGVGEGARQGEVVDMFGPHLLPEFRPALSMLAGRLQIYKIPGECAKSPKAELCVDAVAAAAGDREAAERLRSEIEKVVPEARPLLDKADGRTLVEVLAPGDPQARLAFMLLAAVEGRADAVRLHGLLGSVGLKEPLLRRLFRAVYESCSDLNGEGCRMALLKLYYLHF